MPRRTVLTKTTYLQTTSGPPPALAPPRNDIRTEKRRTPAADEYRDWYRRVGQTFHWVDRLLISEEELIQSIHAPLVEIHLLLVAEEPAGYAELDRRQAGEVELAYFGLFPEFCGQGLGRYFLNWALRRAWSFGPNRVWLHTCDLDHDAALPNYLKAGLQIYDEKLIEQVLEEYEE